MNTVTNDGIVEEIVIQATAERVFDALTDPARRVQWWSVAGRFHTEHMESDLRPGGAWVMRGTAMGGRPFTVRGEYREIERPRLLVFTWLPDWQPDGLESLVRIELDERGGATNVRLTHSGLATDAARSSHKGWPQVLGLLQTYAEQPS